MPDVKLCRICVRKNVKMYEHDRFQLKFYYKEVTGSKISNRDCLPKWFCFECAALLHKFHEFKRKCHHGHKVFKKLLESGCENLDKITRGTKITSLQSHLQILSKSKSVKTYTVKHSEIVYNNKHSDFIEVFVDDIKTDFDSEIDHLNSKYTEPQTLNQSANVIENHTQLNDDELLNDDGLDNDTHNDDSNDNVPLKKFDSNVKEIKLDNVKRTNHVETKLNNIDENRSVTKETGSNVTNNDIEQTNTDINKISCDLKTTCVIKNTVNAKKLNMKDEIKYPDNLNLDNKFQRSVKKKFLDENHWTKITLSDEEASRRFQSKALEQKYLRADFKCTDCYRTFSQEDMMKRHIKLRHCESLGPNECRHCRMRFKWKSRLQKHLKEHYTIYKCLRCELSFPVEISAFQHDYSHNGVTWTCAHCGQRFKHSSTYYTHLRKHKSKYVCTLCGVSFVSEFGLFMHRRVKHVINNDSKEEGANTYCIVCDIKFDTLKGYEEHFAESALHATEAVEGAMSLPLKTRCTKKRVPRISTNCSSCGKTFSTYAAFTKHHLSVHPGVPLPKSRTDRQDGQRQICEVCGATLASAWSLANHLNTHTRDKRYTCKTCGMQLSSRSVLQRHQSTHTTDKNFKCESCDKRFSHRAGLKLHVRTHKKDGSTRSRKNKAAPNNVMEYFKNYGPLANNFR